MELYQESKKKKNWPNRFPDDYNQPSVTSIASTVEHHLSCGHMGLSTIDSAWHMGQEVWEGRADFGREKI